jgi:tRNA U34 5-methylaminomethyl-2-thiouridine-forming methyltransferase MnmC
MMPDDLRIIKTSDGSESLYNPALNETYHSVHGAIRESRHVFIKNGLEYFLTKTENSTCRILEVGFGTGLNALLASEFSRQNKVSIEYFTLEPFPVSKEIYSKLNYPELLNCSSSEFYLFHQVEQNVKLNIHSGFIFEKRNIGLEEVKLEPNSFDVVFFDAFAPSRQPDVWSFENFVKLFSCLRKDGVLVTYCAQGQFRRDLKNAGFDFEVLAGPPWKKEMTRAVKGIFPGSEA